MNAIPAVILAMILALPSASADGLPSEFRTPPDSARPGAYWYFMDGNQDRKEMVADLHAMKRVGLGSVLFLEVDLNMPRGPIPFMSGKWQDNVAHSFVEAGKLGMEVMLGAGPGWAGSGGSWVGIGDSMQHLLASKVEARGPAVFDQILPVPPPHPANRFAGMSPAHAAERDRWFRDVAVLAFPTPAEGVAVLDDGAIKTLKDVKPYSIRLTSQRYIMPRASHDEPGDSRVFDHNRVVDLTALLRPDGGLRWEIPDGQWTILRVVARGTGQTTRPAPQAGHGFECDKFDAASYRRHWENYQKKLLDKVVELGGPLQPGRGLTTIHLDSWEMSSQNWTEDFREEFRKRRGYDPQPFYPAWMGMVVGSVEKTERFLWDMRKTSQELVLEEHAGAIRDLAHEHGLLYSNEPYDMNPAGNIDLGSIADIPMCEFWNTPHDTEYSCIEAAGIANTMGRKVVKAEAFTTGGEAFVRTPANMKNQSDWALAMGINGFMFHTYQHQALGDAEKPGMTMGPYGIHWHRNQTFWEFLGPYHEYLTRCSHLLRQGGAVSDILYLTPEGAPHIFEPPADALTAVSRLRDKKGYSFDAVTPRILGTRAVVEHGRIAFPGGSAYRVLVLPDDPTMTPETLATIEDLVKAGATVIGNPPVKSPSLVDYPDCDAKVAALAGTMWRGTSAPASVSRVEHGRGAIHWGGDLHATDDLYPTHAAVANVLAGLGLPEDFSSPSGKLRFLHRKTADRDIYFVSNRGDEKVVTEGVFRIDGLHPQLWDPVDGTIRDLGHYRVEGGLTRVPLEFAAFQSYFVVFPHTSNSVKAAASPSGNFPRMQTLVRLDGPWDLAFDPDRGGPESITFDSLDCWTKRPEQGIRYYSGVATYRKTFDAPGVDASNHGRTWLDLGVVHDITRVRLNGKDLGVVWTAPWQVDITAVVRTTGNQLEIDVANAWANRLIGDEQPGNKNTRQVSWPSGLLGGKKFPAGRHSFATHRHFKPSSPLRPAGLLGPVRVLSEP